MHVVECPKCHRKFKVPQPVTGTKMKCSRCGVSFVGSSHDEAAAPPAATPVSHAPAGHATTPVRKSTLPAGPLLVAAAVLMVAGVIVMIVLGIKRYDRPTFIVKDAKTGEVLSVEQVSGRAEADRRKEQALTGQDTRRPRPPDGPGATATGPVRPPDSPVDEPVADSDPKLAVSPPQIVEGGSVGEDKYAVGRVRSDYDVPLAWVRVTVLVDGAVGPSDTYPWIPARGEIRYSLLIGSAEGKVTARAQAGKADPSVLVWVVDKVSRAHRADSSNSVAFSGEFINTHDTPGKEVEVYVDYYRSEGIWGGRAPVGRLEDGAAATVGAGKTGHVRFEIPAIHAPVAEVFIARAKGEKY